MAILNCGTQTKGRRTTVASGLLLSQRPVDSSCCIGLNILYKVYKENPHYDILKKIHFLQSLPYDIDSLTHSQEFATHTHYFPVVSIKPPNFVSTILKLSAFPRPFSACEYAASLRSHSVSKSALLKMVSPPEYL
jgi:hypothetical protein